MNAPDDTWGDVPLRVVPEPLQSALRARLPVMLAAWQAHRLTDLSAYDAALRLRWEEWWFQQARDYTPLYDQWRRGLLDPAPPAR